MLESYPEKSLVQKYVHFMMYGRTLNWHYEGMDRNRCYFWLSAPLEFTTVFNYAMNCPDTQKTSGRFYRAILEEMSPDSCRIVYAQHRVAPASFLFPIVLKMNSAYQKMSPSLRRRVKTILRQNREGIPTPSLISECIKEQMNSCPILREYLSNKHLDGVLQKSNALQRKVLLTVTSVIEDIATYKSWFEEYQERDFI